MDTNRARRPRWSTAMRVPSQNLPTCHFILDAKLEDQLNNFASLTMSISIIHFNEYTSGYGNDNPWFMFWVEPSEPIDLPIRIQPIDRPSHWYVSLARKKWINRDFVKFGQRYCEGYYALNGDDNTLSLTADGKELFLRHHDELRELEDFSIWDSRLGKIEYRVSGIAHPDIQDEITCSLN